MELLIIALFIFLGVPAFMFAVWVSIISWSLIKRIEDIKQGKVVSWDTNE